MMHNMQDFVRNAMPGCSPYKGLKSNKWFSYIPVCCCKSQQGTIKIPGLKSIQLFCVIFIQSAKILQLPSKYVIIMLPSNHSVYFQYCDSNIGLFSFAPCKVITLNPFSTLFGISSLLFFMALFKVIALLTIVLVIVIALTRS